MTDFGTPQTNPYAHLGAANEPSVAEGTEFISGESNSDLSDRDLSQSSSVSLDSIVSALTTVFDPEIPVNIYDLGLIYEIRRVSEPTRASDNTDSPTSTSSQSIVNEDIDNEGIANDSIANEDIANEGMGSEGIDWEILMTLTAPACPVAGELPQQVADAAASVEGAGRVRVRLTWSPPWTPEMMSEDAHYALGM